MKLPWSRVSCGECGYLSYLSYGGGGVIKGEVQDEYRSPLGLASLQDHGGGDGLFCFRGIEWDLPKGPEGPNKVALTREQALEADEAFEKRRDAWREQTWAPAILKDRECSRFFRYVPSYSPERHLALQERAKDHTEIRRGYVVSGGITGLFTVLGVIATLLLTRPGAVTVTLATPVPVTQAPASTAPAEPAPSPSPPSPSQ